MIEPLPSTRCLVQAETEPDSKSSAKTVVEADAGQAAPTTASAAAASAVPRRTALFMVELLYGCADSDDGPGVRPTDPGSGQPTRRQEPPGPTQVGLDQAHWSFSCRTRTW